MGVAKSLEALQVLAERPGLIRFTSGVPDPAIIRPDALAELTQAALERGGTAAYQGYGPHAGLEELREAVARRMDPSGKSISAEQVLITSGSQQAVSVLAQAALEQEQRVACEVPCYMGMPNAFGAIGHWVESVPRDPEGPLPDRFQRLGDGRPILFYLCPELHNPMGTDISPARRGVLLEWARRQNVTLIADEIFHDLRFEGQAPASFLADAGAERTVVIGSLSKSFMCGLRIGWLVSSAERVRALVGLKRAMDISCPPLMQGLALTLLRSGAYDEHAARARQHYRTRRDAALKALKEHMPKGVSWTHPKGGFHLWVELPPGYSSIALYLLAIERGVAISPGPQMDVDHRFIPAFRLSYGSVEPAKIRKGIELLGDATRQLLRQKASDPGLSGLGSLL
jgi:DNA-binding transcriptional MocR family regulator